MSNKDPFPSKDKKKLLMTLLKIMGGAKVCVSFSGGGDSGNIDDAELLDAEGNPIDLKGAEFEWESEESYHDPEEGKWRMRSIVEIMPLNDILVKITEDTLESTDLDWYNNDGGQGQLSIDLTTTPPSIELEVGVNYTHTENHNFDFTETEEEENAPTSSQSN